MWNRAGRDLAGGLEDLQVGHGEDHLHRISQHLTSQEPEACGPQ